MDGMIAFLHNTPVDELSNLDNARGSLIPADFRYQTFDAASLPNTVIVQPMVVGAFKSNCSYCAVLMAYRNATGMYDVLYASSEPSTAFKISKCWSTIHLLLKICKQFMILVKMDIVSDHNMLVMLLVLCLVVWYQHSCVCVLLAYSQYGVSIARKRPSITAGIIKVDSSSKSSLLQMTWYSEKILIDIQHLMVPVQNLFLLTNNHHQVPSMIAQILN